MKLISKNSLGLLITIILSISILSIYYGNPIQNLNTTYFATSGDGLKDYYNSFYLIQHDTSYWHSYSMNYPHGEHVLYTGCQPAITHTIKYISQNITDISGYTVGIINFFMIISLILGSIFLYLLLTHFSLPYLYSAVVAIGITFLTPQLGRMSGHFSLSYTFVIPLVLYLTAIFHQKPRYWISIIMGLFMLWTIGIHVYIVGFYAFIVLCYWGYIFIFKWNKTDKKTSIYHIAIQFFVPLLIFILITSLTDSIQDRPTTPWGFLHYRAYPESVLLPIGRPYAKFLSSILKLNHIDWEGYAFIGLIGAVGFFVLVFKSFKLIAQKNFMKAFTPPSEKITLKIFFWTSIIALLYSFGVPFVFDMKWLIDYIGPLKQMRGIARFSWIFYYVINIYIFYLIWHLGKSKINKFLWYGIVLTSLSILWYDAWHNVKVRHQRIDNTIPVLADIDNRSEDNQWIEKIEIDKYQAILPIPYYHIGSENIWISSQKGTNTYTYIVSWKTGIPSMGVNMSRTSLAQTYMNLQLIWEPYREPDILKLLNPDQNILLLVNTKDTDIPEPQKDIVKRADSLFMGDNFSLYSISVDTLSTIFYNLYEKERAIFSNLELFSHEEFSSTSPTDNFLVEDFSDHKEPDVYITGGSKSQRFSLKKSFYEATIPSDSSNQNYTLSFWLKDYNTDLIPRSRLIIELTDSLNNVYDYQTSSIFKLMVTIDEPWTLIEHSITIKNPGDRLKFWLSNYELRKKHYTISHIMLRPENISVYKYSNDWLMRDNRYYLEDD